MRRLAALLALAVVPLPVARAQLAERPTLVEVRTPKAPTVSTGTGGRFLTYELHVTNFEARPLQWQRVEVLDAASGAVLHAATDSTMGRDLSRPGAGSVATIDRPRLPGGARAVLFLHVPLAGPAPAAVAHRLTLVDSLGARTLRTAAVPVTAEAVVIGPPLRGGDWLAANGPGNTSGHRRALLPLGGTPAIAQRYAIDYVRVDSASRTFHGDRLDNANYYAEDADAIAVADGRVVAVKDSIPENVPGATSRAVPITLETVGGNHVILDLGQGRFAFYAHVRPGSIRVRVGDRVTRGQLLAKVGNSGNSTEPHLHFHLSDANSPLGSEGVPYVHEALEVVGRCRTLGSACERTAPVARARVMPFDGDLVRFPR